MRTLFLSCLLFLSASELHSLENNGADVFFSVSRAPGCRCLSPADAQTLDLPAVEEAGAGSAADLLDQGALPYVRRLNGPSGLATVSLRGFQAKQTAVFLDDVRLPPDITGTVDLSVLPAAGLGRAEILPGAASSLYGPDAEGGVVQLFTRRLSPGARLAEAGADAGSYGTRDEFVKAGASGRAGDIFVAGTSGYTAGFQQNSAVAKNSASGRATLGLGGAGTLEVTALFSRLHTGLPSGTPVPVSEWNGSAERRANSLTDWQTSSRGFLAASWNGGSGNLKLRADASLSSNRINAFQYGALDGATVTDRGLSARATLYGSSVIGAESGLSSLGSGTYGDHGISSFGFFAQTALEPARGLQVTPSARLDRSGVYAARLSPKLSAVYVPDEKWKFSVSAGAGFQPPTFADLYNPWAAPAPGLKPETSMNYSVGLDYGSPAGWRAGLSGYYCRVRDRITLDPVTWGAENLSSAYNYGLEARFGWASGPLQASAAYERAVSMARNGGGPYALLNFSPRDRSSVSAAASFGAWRASAGGRGVSEQYTGLGRGGLRLPEYWVFGARLSRKAGPAEFWAGVDNIFNRHYAETADVFNGWFPQPGRTWSAGLTMRLL